MFMMNERAMEEQMKRIYSFLFYPELRDPTNKWNKKGF